MTKLEEINELLLKGISHRESSPTTSIGINAAQFINFALDDSKEDTIKNKVNAISNVKRAIECRIDEIFYALCLHVKSEKENWNFPKKIDVLDNLGVIAPRILKKINKKRNDLEHKYIEPSKNEVDEALDVAILFIGYTDSLFNVNLNIDCIRSHIHKYDIKINRVKNEIEFNINGEKNKLKINADDGWLQTAKLLAESIKRH